MTLVSNKVSAILLFTAGILTFNTMEAIVKGLPDAFSTWNILLFRYLFGLAFVLPFAVSSLKGIDRSTIKLGAVRGVLALCSAGCFFTAVRLVPLAQASALIFSSPLFSQILSQLILKERMPRLSWVALALGFLGVVSIFASAYTPGDDLFLQYVGLMLAICSAFIFSLMLIFSKIQVNNQVRLKGGNDVLALVVQSATGLFLILPLGVTNLPPMDVQILFRLATVGALGSAGLLLLSLSFRKAAMSHVSIYQFTGVLWATFYGYVFFSERPVTLQIVGMILILSAILWLEFIAPILNRKVVISCR